MEDNKTGAVELPPGVVLKRINMEQGWFMANGKKYIIETQLSVARFCEYQILQKEFAMGMTIKKFFEELSKMYQLLNQTRFVDASVVLRNVMDGIIALEAKEPAAMKICTLFINEENENRADWNNDMVNRKMEDWKKEGIVADDFFAVAFSTLPTYIKLYNTLTQNISAGIGGVVDALNELLRETKS